MNESLAAIDFDRLWKRLQQLGLNAYESRCYLVLVGHPRFKALELASRAEVPRQKIYEVLDALMEKGFALTVHEKTKLFSAVPPQAAIEAFLERRRQGIEKQLQEQAKLGSELIEDLRMAYQGGQEESGTLDYLRIINETEKSAVRYRKLMASAKTECLEFWRAPFEIDSEGEERVRQALQRGVICRVLVERTSLTERLRELLGAYAAAGVEIRQADVLPMKLSLFDGKQGMFALLDPVTTQPAWTSVIFDHASMGEAMKGLFEAHWRMGAPLEGAERSLGAAN